MTAPIDETTKRDEKGRILPRARVDEATQQDTATQTEPEGIMGFIQSKLSGPVASTVISTNRDALVLAGRTKIGKVLNERIRNGVIANFLPGEKQPDGTTKPNALLQNPFVCGLVDLAVSNLFLTLLIVFGDKLPPALSKYGMILARCTTAAAYADTFGCIDFESMLNKVIGGDLLSILKEADAQGL
jgi:hypothetical protein